MSFSSQKLKKKEHLYTNGPLVHENDNRIERDVRARNLRDVGETLERILEQRDKDNRDRISTESAVRRYAANTTVNVGAIERGEPSESHSSGDKKLNSRS